MSTKIKALSWSASLLALASPVTVWAQAAAPAESTSADASGTGVEIVVTATRRSEVLSKVPASISALGRASLDNRGLKDLSGIVRQTPGIQLDQTGFGNQTVIAIRGVSSTTGAATTGIYIDDTPIQSRNIGYAATNIFPSVFDLDRVEVLRGPQGTLFGAGSQGGTVRFITPQPSLTGTRIYGRAEGAATQGGAPSGEIGLSVSTPLVTDRLALTVSGWVRRDGGYIDRANGNPEVLQPAYHKNANWMTSKVLRAALRWAPVEGLDVTPSVFFQEQYRADVNYYWEGLSDPSRGRFVNGQPQASPDKDRFYMPALNVSYTTGGVKIINNVSYYVRDQRSAIDYSTLWPSTFLNTPFIPGSPNHIGTAYNTNTQRTFTEELRLQSDLPDAALSWVAGVFYSRSVQRFTEDVVDPDFGDIPGLIGLSIEDFLGNGPLLPGGLSLSGFGRGVDKQLAGFGEATVRVSDKLKLTAGLRVARTSFTGSSFFNGPVSGFQLQNPTSASETPVTPKFSVNYQANPDLLVYATVAKGYRIGGVNAPLNSAVCLAALNQLGLPAAPATYKSDTLWSYEAGAKAKALGGRLNVSASAFHIDWKGIQQNVSLSCGGAFVSNLGRAKSDGFDLELSAKVSPNLSIDGSVGYTNARLADAVNLGGTTNLGSAGDSLVTYPWTANLGATLEQPVGENGHLYLRGDYQFKSRGRSNTATNPANASYVVGAYPAPTLNFISLRAGLRRGPIDLSLYVDNLANAHTIVSRSVDAFDPLSHLPGDDWHSIIVRPRTLGVTLVFRQ